MFGAVALFLCGIGDWLIGYEPPGGEPLVFGITRTSIAAVPTWLYVLSLFFGILSGFGCRSFAPAMIGILEKSGVPGDSKTVRLFRFGLSSAPMMFVSFHAACCIVLIMIQAALRRGLDVKAADSAFLLPAAAARNAADRNPYSWNMEFLPYADGSGYEARFSRCGICTLMGELGLIECVPAMCRLDYAMSEAGGADEFVRKYTLASGGPYCDCGYKRKKRG